MGDFTMPSLGADMDRGTLSEWKVAPGDHVSRGDIIAVIETEKSDVDVEVFETGVVDELLVETGTEVAVGAPLARISAGEDASAVEEKATSKPRAKRVRKAATKPTPAPTPTPTSEPAPRVGGGAGHRHASVILSPVVRHLAEHLHVEAEHLEGTGVGARVTRADVEAAAHAAPAPSPSTRGAPKSSPLARRQAAEQGIDLSDVPGSGPGGAVRVRDLAALPTHVAAAAPSPTKAVSTKVGRKAAMRSAIARLMSQANREIPHYHVTSTIDLHNAVGWLEHHNASHPPAERMLLAAVLLRATAVGAAQVRELNGFWEDDRFTAAEHVDLGVAISLRGGGVVTPTIAAVDQLSLVDTMEALKELVVRARRGALRSADLDPASLTVTNLGDQGAEEVIGVIHPPQVGLVGFGRPVDRVCAVDGMVAIRPAVRATVSGDHRATDGHAGSLLLAAISKALDHSEQL